MFRIVFVKNTWFYVGFLCFLLHFSIWKTSCFKITIRNQVIVCLRLHTVSPQVETYKSFMYIWNCLKIIGIIYISLGGRMNYSSTKNISRPSYFELLWMDVLPKKKPIYQPTKQDLIVLLRTVRTCYKTIRSYSVTTFRNPMKEKIFNFFLH